LIGVSLGQAKAPGVSEEKDGSIRFGVNYRKLNEVTKLDTYPLPRINDCFNCIENSSWSCTLDLKSGYWQVHMAQEDIEKTAFITHGGLYEYFGYALWLD